MAQTFIQPGDGKPVHTEFRDGKEIAFVEKNGVTVGLANYKESDDYGTYYQLGIIVRNQSDSTILFDPQQIYATVTEKDGFNRMVEVFTYDKYKQAANRSRSWQQFWNILSDGFISSASSDAELRMEAKMARKDILARGANYLKKNTLNPGEFIAGYINVRYKKGVTMDVGIPLAGTEFDFKWDIAKKKKQK